MPLNFPLLPAVDTQYTFEDRTWVWNGRFWKAISTTIGYTGSQGAGFTGSIGFTGSRGPAGTSVTIVGSVASSSGLPDPYSGSLGDGYIARDTGNLWVWTGNTWSDVGQIQGYTGSQGYSGSVGYTGSAGADGFIGRDGYTGSIGFTGSRGIAGEFAGQGYTGSKGDLGYTGSDGAFAGMGYTGSQGDPGEYAGMGYTGSEGVQGSTGFTGSQGIPGEYAGMGYTGSQGLPGEYAAVGFSGSKGDIGFTGSQGEQGIPGTYAAIGYTGSQGYGGSLGYTGSVGGFNSLQSFTTVSTASYTLLANDGGNMVRFTYAGNITVTIPNDSTLNFSVGQRIDLQLASAGYLAIAGEGGVTLNAAGGALYLVDQYSAASVIKISANTWNLVGPTTSGFTGSIGFTGSQGAGFTGSQGYTGSIGGFASIQTINDQTTNYTLVGTDIGKLVRFTSASTLTLTVPLNSVVPFAVGQRIDVSTAGLGGLLIAGEGGVTVSASNASLALFNQYATGTLVKMDTDTWLFIGPASSGFSGSVGYTGSQGAGFTGSRGYTGSIGGFASVQEINDQTINYTLQATDIGKLVRFTSVSTLTLTVPLDSVVSFAIGQRIDVSTAGVGGVLIAGSGGVTISAANSSLSLINQYSAGTLVKTATDTWLFIGPVSSGYTGSAGSLGYTGSVGFTGSAAAFSGLSDAASSSLTIDKFYLPAITRLTVTANGSTAYRFDQYGTADDPTIYAINGTTIAFDLGTGALSSHPFLIQTSPGGVPYDTGLVHVTAAGVVSTGSAAQGKTSGTLYWKIPSVVSGSYRYICANHSGMVGTIIIKEFSAI